MRPINIIFIFVFFSGILFSSCGNDTKTAYPEESFLLDTARIQHFPMPSSIRAIETVDDQTCWFAGSNGKYGYTNDGGQSWHVDSLVHPEHGPLHFRSIAVTDEAVHILSIASPALLYRSTDQGENWDLVYQEDDSLAFYDALAFWDDQRGIAMGDPTDGCLSIILTSDGGRSWTKVSCDQLPPAAEGEAAFAASDGNISLYGSNAWVVSGGKKARVFHSPDYGQTWSVYDTPIAQGGTMTGIFGSDFYDDQTGMIIGGDWEKMEDNTNNKAITKDGGKTWQLIADGQLPGYRSSIQYLSSTSPDHLLSVGIPGITYSEDGGQSWTQLSDEAFYTSRKANQVVWLGGNRKMAKWPISN